MNALNSDQALKVAGGVLDSPYVPDMRALEDKWRREIEELIDFLSLQPDPLSIYRG